MKFADLHLHTIFSDGTYTPFSLISECENQGLSAISVTDHDTVNGIQAVAKIAEDKDIEVLPGIELTAEYEGKEIHILGYLIDSQNELLLKRLEILKENRIERAYKIIDKLKGEGVILRPESVFGLAKQGTVGRLHIARAMVKEGVASSILEAFQKYIGDKCPAYVLDFRLSAKEAIKLIIDSAGIPVLAHPHTINNDEVIFKFIDYGLMGLEAYYPEHSQAMINFYLDLAKKHNLLITGGSDCHGEAKPQAKIGSVKVPYALVEELKIAKDKRR